MKTKEKILEEMAGLISAAEERALTDEEAATYEQLEGDLKAAQRDLEIRSRHAAYTMPTTPALLTATSSKDDTLDRAFEHYMRTGKENGDIAELRAQSVGVDAAGGYTVPDGFRVKLVERMKAFGGLAGEVETITTETGNPLPWPTLDDTANQGTIAAEGAAGTGGSDLVFGEITLGAFKYVAPGADNTGSDPLRVSVELLQDSAFDIAGLVARKLGERIARKQAVHWVRGVGTTEPFGITTSSGASVQFAGTAPTFGELVTALHSVDPAYRTSGVWAFNDKTLSVIRQIVDGNSRPLWLPQQESGMTTMPGGTLLGHRVVIDQAFADYTDVTTNVWGVFGDLREGYVIRRVKDVTLIVDPYTRAAQGQVNYTVWARADGTVQNPNAFSKLVNVTP